MRARRRWAAASWLPWLAGAVALGMIAFGWWWLEPAQTGLSVRQAQVGELPLTLLVRADRADAVPGAAPVVVVAHGFAGSRQLMRPLGEALAQAGYRALLFDFPGHGRHRQPLAGTLGAPERVASLTGALAEALAFARALPDAETAGIALLGHSMAGDILFRQAGANPGIAAVVALSPYLSDALDAAPRNPLLIYGALEPEALHDMGRAALHRLTGSAQWPTPSAADFAAGEARAIALVPGVEHIGVLYSPTAARVARDWLDATFERVSPASSATGGGRGWALALVYGGLLLLAWPWAQLLPRSRAAPLGAGLDWRRFWSVALVPALLTPLLLWPLPVGFLPLPIGDYLAVHCGLYGVLTLVGIRLADGRSPWLAFAAGSRRRLLLAVVWWSLLALVLIGLPTDRFVASFLPGSERWLITLAVFAGTLWYFVADEWLTRGPRAARGGYLATKLLFLLSLMLAVWLKPEERFFLVIIVPAILPLFALYGWLGHLATRHGGNPVVGGLTNALVFAAVISVTFPIVAR